MFYLLISLNIKLLFIALISTNKLSNYAYPLKHLYGEHFDENFIRYSFI